MLIPPDSVIVRRRIRKDPGDLAPLMESLKRYGQLSPIIINRNRELIAGFRRLQAAKRLGWQTIDALMVDRQEEGQKLELEIEENVQRRDLSPDELAEGLRRLHTLMNPGLLRRIWAFLVRIFRTLFRRRR
jgi:ParB family chromosome partitioning protein